ncbi:MULTISPECIES: hypothetical protein [Anaerococcus]|uniref:Uncharacterized protein n=1 Tax=Anaerococcus nagyae TaxID=1755241 RepID=A0A3E2TFU5_9FIRM|nr:MULTISPECIES: hypothetical protein [Anaerococcus]MBP2070246.1 hypothetical protein [Anaerococcus nagyae]MDU2353658.1 hypothetical protein [Anaerococcus sp.]MDU3211811.1 hypothetical protein [Anaerococcus sp.]RGB74716.1 hypothetical protein DXA39_08100 [Anaerococcus nagyae]
MDYSLIFRQLQEIITNNRISFIPIIFIIVNLLIFIISRTFRKTGLFVLALAFGIDYAIKSLPFDLYYNVPGLYNAVTILYVVGFMIFFVKIAKMLIKISKLNIDQPYKTDSKIGHFLKFTGMAPFLIMLIANLLKIENYIGIELTRIFTSAAFLFMLIKTLISTYKYLSTKESIVLGDKMDFKEIKDYLKEDTKSKNKTNSKNSGRKTRKTLNSKVDDPTQAIEPKDVRKKIKVSQVSQVKNYDFDLNDSKHAKLSINREVDDPEISNTELLRMLTGGFDDPRNETTIAITNLKSGNKISYTSKRPILKIHEQSEYKIDLEFESINEYDYGRFIDILLTYSKSKNDYKFELIAKPAMNISSSIIFFDPSNIYDIDEKDYANVSGKVISMNFPKYKVNFITGN